MERFNELMAKLNKLNITQTKGDWAENIPNDIWEEYFRNNFKEVARGLDVDTHRWYETSVSVISVCGGLLGIDYITNMFSEGQDYEDCCHTMSFDEMEEFTSIAYRTKSPKQA